MLPRLSRLRCVCSTGDECAPDMLRQALRLLPVNLTIPLPSMTITPYVPVPETNGEEWDRLEPASALDALVELVLHGEYNGVLNAKRTRDGMELRGAALGVFQVGSWMSKWHLSLADNFALELCVERRYQGSDCAGHGPAGG